MRRATLLILIGAACAPGGQGYFPLKEGHQWSYSVRAGFITRVDEVRVVGRRALANADGWRLTGPMGESTMAWLGKTLVADSLPGTRFLPPIPMLSAASPPESKTWEGLVSTMGNTVQGQASLSHETDQYEIDGRKVEARVSVLSLNLGKSTIVLRTWYVEGIGPVRQEQRNDGISTMAATYLAGP